MKNLINKNAEQRQDGAKETQTQQQQPARTNRRRPGRNKFPQQKAEKGQDRQKETQAKHQQPGQTNRRRPDWKKSPQQNAEQRQDGEKETQAKQQQPARTNRRRPDRKQSTQQKPEQRQDGEKETQAQQQQPPQTNRRWPGQKKGPQQKREQRQDGEKETQVKQNQPAQTNRRRPGRKKGPQQNAEQRQDGQKETQAQQQQPGQTNRRRPGRKKSPQQKSEQRQDGQKETQAKQQQPARTNHRGPDRQKGPQQVAEKRHDGQKETQVKQEQPAGTDSSKPAGKQSAQKSNRYNRKKQNNKGQSNAVTSGNDTGKDEKSPKDGGRKKPQAKQPAKPKPQKIQEIAKPINKAILIPKEKILEYEYAKFYDKFEDYLLKNLLVEDGAKILCAVSGGVDSVVLLDALANVSHKFGFKLYIVHFNHQLRGESSDMDEAFVRKMALDYNIPFHTTKGNVKKFSERNSMSIEDAARTLRYRFIEQTAKTIKVNYIVTAHTLDDSAETFFLNLFRGSGLKGLRGIPANRSIGKSINIIRPLLQFQKTELIIYANKRGLPWREDETNSLMHYTRNKIRHDLLKKIRDEYSPAIIDIINRTSRLFRGADEFITDHVKQKMKFLVCNKKNNRFALRIPLLQTNNDFIQGEIMQTALKNNFKIQAVSIKTVERLLGLMSSESGSICEITKQIYALKDRQLIIFIRRQPNVHINMKIERKGEYQIGNYELKLTEIQKKKVKFTNDPNVEYFDMDLIPNIITFRTREEGDVFRPIGMKGKMKVSDFLTNSKISLIDKQDVVMLSTSSDIIWLCGYRADDRFKITDSTTRVLKAEFIYNE